MTFVVLVSIIVYVGVWGKPSNSNLRDAPKCGVSLKTVTPYWRQNLAWKGGLARGVSPLSITFLLIKTGVFGPKTPFRPYWPIWILFGPFLALLGNLLALFSRKFSGAEVSPPLIGKLFFCKRLEIKRGVGPTLWTNFLNQFLTGWYLWLCLCVWQWVCAYILLYY